jgi:NAD(P)-dependent dehydrogenase (short-subunit alcohol dehydrogenase family)
VSAAVQAARRAVGSGSSAAVHGYTADLSSLAAVRQLAAAVRSDHPRLHALVNNAGVYEQQQRCVVAVWWRSAGGGRRSASAAVPLVQSLGACHRASAADVCVRLRRVPPKPGCLPTAMR